MTMRPSARLVDVSRGFIDLPVGRGCDRSLHLISRFLRTLRSGFGCFFDGCADLSANAGNQRRTGNGE